MQKPNNIPTKSETRNQVENEASQPENQTRQRQEN